MTAAPPPTAVSKHTSLSAGIDLCAENRVVINPRQSAEVSVLWLPEKEKFDFTLQPRSGLFVQNMVHAVMDSDSVKENKNRTLTMCNDHPTKEFVVEPGMRIAQIIMRKSPSAAIFVREIFARSDEEVPTGVVTKIGPRNIRFHDCPANIRKRTDVFAQVTNTKNYPIFIFGGVIDPDYKGEITVLALNNSEEEIIRLDDKKPVAKLMYYEFDDKISFGCTSKTVRGSKGFGSTGFFSHHLT